MSLPDIDHRRTIIDRRSIADRIAALPSGKKASRDACNILHEALENGRAEVARGFIRATWRGLNFFRTNRAGTLPIISKYMKVDRDMAQKIYDDSVDSLTDAGFVSEDFQRKVLEFEFGRADDAMLQKAFDFSVVKSLR